MKSIIDIPYGHKNKLQRPFDSYEDRVLRKQIAKANNEGDCIINVGSGYYRPIPGDEIDEKEFKEYLEKELSRARATLKKRLSMKMTFERWRKCERLSDNTKRTG